MVNHFIHFNSSIHIITNQNSDTYPSIVLVWFLLLFWWSSLFAHFIILIMPISNVFSFETIFWFDFVSSFTLHNEHSTIHFRSADFQIETESKIRNIVFLFGSSQCVIYLCYLCIWMKLFVLLHFFFFVVVKYSFLLTTIIHKKWFLFFYYYFISIPIWFTVIGYDQPCDLRLLTPATCLKELSEPVITTKSPPNLLLLKSELDSPPERTSTRKSALDANVAAAAALTATTASNNNFYMCKKCGNSYARPHSLNRHLRFECGVEPKFECPICRKKSKHKHNLVLHMRTHQNR